MKIFGIGTDIVNINRLDKSLKIYGKAFKKRVFSVKEINYCEKKNNASAFYAKRFAAKEACAKALGIGIARGIFWKDISVENNILGKPKIKLTGNALKRLRHLSQKECLIEISLSDEKKYAIANVVIFKQDEIS